MVEDSNLQIIKPIEFDPSLIKKEVNFSVPGKPFGKQRPKFVRQGQFARAYTPKKTVSYENHVKNSYIETSNREYLEGPISADLIGVFPIPKSTTKKKRKEMLEGTILPAVKPYCDNIGKSVLDALNGLAYSDDSHICKLFVDKIYGE